jgi:anaerobic nitric oxide reductase transcription regulator
MSIDRPQVATGHLVRDILLDLACAVRCDARVLITGDRRPGKKEIAETIHRGSRRAARRFVSVDCASTTEGLLEWKLFGRARAGVPGPDRDTRGLLEQADGGTIFLANVGALGPALQARLARFLENGQIRRVGADHAHTAVDVRVIASADRDLFPEVEGGRFNADLYYRLNVVHLLIPEAQRSGNSPTGVER